MRLERRVSELERASGGLKRWHRVIQHYGESQDEAIAAYEEENGPVGGDNCLIVCIVKPPAKFGCG